jgi:hypothetical protein
MALDYFHSTFCVFQTTAAEFGLRADNKKFCTQNEA